jgi:predicted SnoaL-like aldol condensation-catalyzing enzyme
MKMNERHVDVARRMVQAFSGRPIDDIGDLLAENYLDHQGAGAGPLIGRDAFIDLVTMSRAAHREQEVVILEFFTSGPFVAMRLEWRRTDHDGAESSRETIEIVRFSAGKAIEHWGHRTT